MAPPSRLAVADGVRDGVRDGVGDGDGEGEGETLPEDEGVGGERVSLPEDEGVGEGVSPPEGVPEGEVEDVGETVGVGETCSRRRRLCADTAPAINSARAPASEPAGVPPTLVSATLLEL